jgi:ribonuclease P protein component
MRIYGLNFKEMQYTRQNNIKYYQKICLCLFNKNVNEFKCTIVIKKKQIKTAVMRNKIRRRCRAILQLLYKQNPIQTHSVLIWSFKEAIDYEMSTLQRNLQNIYNFMCMKQC